jgi:hypothetical protein
MALTKRPTQEKLLWRGKGKWKGWRLGSPKAKGKGYVIVNLTRLKNTPLYSIMSSPNVIRLAYKPRK